jgi:cyclophilin family peptidyl-prolyl cis-trans isomerase
VPKATKRERQRINREIRREAMRKAEQRRKRIRTARNIAIPIVIVGILFAVLRLTQGESSNAIQRSFSKPPAQTIDPTKTYTATIDTTEGTMVAALDAVNAPVAVNNFVFLAKNRFYDGLDFIRVAKDFVIQAGSPDNTQSGGPGYTVQGEVPKPAEGQPAYPVGAMAMAKGGTEAPGTAGSQFFIVIGSGNAGLSPDYANVGQLTSGLDVAQKIGQLYPKSGDGPPTKKVTIKKLTIATSPATSTTAPATTAAP